MLIGKTTTLRRASAAIFDSFIKVHVALLFIESAGITNILEMTCSLEIKVGVVSRRRWRKVNHIIIGIIDF